MAEAGNVERRTFDVQRRIQRAFLRNFAGEADVRLLEQYPWYPQTNMLRSHQADHRQHWLTAGQRLAAFCIAAAVLFAAISAPAETPRSGGRASARVGIDTTFGELVREARKAYHAKKYEKAVELYTSALQMRPDPVNAAMLYTERGLANAACKKHAAVVADYDRASRLQPRETWLHNNAAWLRATSPDARVRNGKLAVRQATRACELTGWKNSYGLDTLAAAYAEVGDFEAAVRWQKDAISRAPLSQRNDMHKRLRLYQNGQPYRLK